MKSIAFICVNFNNSDYTKKLIKSLRNQINLDKEFVLLCVVIDNSTDTKDSKNLVEYCNIDKDWIQYIKSPNNLGYFGGLNLGLSKIEKKNIDFVIIGNNDLEFRSNFCINLINKQYLKEVFAICPDIITKDGFHQNPHHLKKISYLKRLQFDIYFSHYLIGVTLISIKKIIMSMIKQKHENKKIILHECEINQGVGACYVLTPMFFTSINELYFPWFLYGEEACFSWQIHDKKGILWFDPSLKVDHEESATLSRLPKRTTYEFGKTSYWGLRHLI